jgi:hypothetical protein
MLSLNRRSWARRSVPVLVAILLAVATRVAAAAPRAPLGVIPCQTVISDFLARAPIMGRSDERTVQLLDGRHYREAASALRSAVSRYPDAWAGQALGDLYAAGLGLPRSAPEAFRWYLWSAQRGDRFAQRLVANAYLNGDGTQRNAAAAAYWFRIGVAPFQLAWMYHGLSQTYTDGILAPVNRAKAAYYLDESLTELRQLAKEPNGEAAYYLGLAYEYGDGVPRNRTQAIAYLCRAGSLQYAAAIGALRRLQGRSP